MTKARKISKTISKDYKENIELENELKEAMKNTEDLTEYKALEILYKELKKHKERDKALLKKSLRNNK